MSKGNMNTCWKVIGILLGMLLMAACARPDDDLVETRHGTSQIKQVPEPAVPEDHRRVEGPSQKLQAIDSLMWRQPDSAFALLLQFVADPEANGLDTYNRHYCQLLVSELLYKNDCEQTNRKDLLQAVYYFDSLCGCTDVARHVSTDPTIAFLDARAHYINGVGYYERDSVVEACKEYLKALDVMEGRFEEKDLTGHKARLLFYTNNRLGDLFSSQYMMESSVNCYKNALSFYLKKPSSPTGAAGILNMIGIQYDMMGNKDTAMFYYEKALEALPDTSNLTYRNVLSSKALLSYQMNHDVQSAMMDLQGIVRQTNNENEKLVRYLTIGDIYFEDGLYDTARYYLELVFEKSGDVISQIRAAEFLRTIYDLSGEKEKSDTCVQFLANHKKSDAENKAFVSELNNLFQQYLDTKKERRVVEEQNAAVRNVLKIIIPLSMVVAFLIIVFAKIRSNNLLKKQQKETNRVLYETEQQHRMEQAAMSGRLKRSNQEVRELKDQIKQMDDLAAKSETAASFNEEPICRLIMERVHDGQFKSKIDCEIYKSYALDKQQLLDLRMAADRHFSQFTLRLRKAYPKLTSIDIDYCCLYLLNLTHADVSALMQRAYNTVVERDGKIQKIIGSEKPLPVTLMDIAKNPSSI